MQPYACLVSLYTSRWVTGSGVARPGPTRACALPSTSQALPSPGQQDSLDSSMNTKKQTYFSSSANTIRSHFRSISVIPGYAPDGNHVQIN